MNEKTNKLNHYLNEFFLKNDIKNNIVFDNLNLFYNLAMAVESIFCDVFSKKIEIDYEKISKVSLFEKIKIVKDFYRLNDINFDIDKCINDGTIEFLCYDYFYDNEDLDVQKRFQFGYGNNKYENNHKIINVVNNGMITDCLILIHELSHLRNQPESKRNQISHLLTESLSYADELIASDYLMTLGYNEDCLWRIQYMYSIFYNIARVMRPIYNALNEMITIFQIFGNISKENYLNYFKDDKYYDINVNLLLNFFEQQNINVYYAKTYCLFASALAPFIYFKYEKDSEYYKKVLKVYEKINLSTLFECFDTLEVSDFSQLISALEKVKSTFFLEKNKRLNEKCHK